MTNTTNNAANPKKKLSIAQLTKLITSTLDDNKAKDIVTLDLEGKTDIADFMIVASGTSDRHVGAIAQHLIKNLKDNGINAPAEGLSDCNWVLVDASRIIVHIFRPEVREYYNLEKMWQAFLPQVEAAIN